MSGTGIFIFLTILVIVGFAIGVFADSAKRVTIIDSGTRIETATTKSTVGGVLKENGIRVDPGDFLSTPQDTRLKKDKENNIVIKRAVPVVVTAGGRTVTLMTYQDTVKTAIMYSPIEMDSNDRFDGVTGDDPIVEGMDIKVVRVDEQITTSNVTIPYEVEYVRNNGMQKGEETIVREGNDGLVEREEKVIIEDGIEISRTYADKEIIPVISKIIESGTLATYTTSTGATIKYTDKIPLDAVSYSAVIDSSDPDNVIYGRTYLGYTARRGVIAVDPAVIPLGSKVYIEVVFDSIEDYGFAVAGDIGSGIKGYVIDLCFDSFNETLNWGRRKVNVYILAED